MKKYIIFVIILLVPLFAKAETLYGFMDNKFYNAQAELKVFGFMDGSFYDMQGRRIWRSNGEFVYTAPVYVPSQIVYVPVYTPIFIPQPISVPSTTTPKIIQPEFDYIALEKCHEARRERLQKVFDGYFGPLGVRAEFDSPKGQTTIAESPWTKSLFPELNRYEDCKE